LAEVANPANSAKTAIFAVADILFSSHDWNGRRGDLPLVSYRFAISRAG
jgi:hypothetical protein